MAKFFNIVELIKEKDPVANSLEAQYQRQHPYSMEEMMAIAAQNQRDQSNITFTKGSNQKKCYVDGNGTLRFSINKK